MPDILKVRENLHKFIDPMWQSGWKSREDLYSVMGVLVGREAHISEMSMEELEKVCRFFSEIYKGWPCKECANCVAYRYFLPVCSLGQQRKEARCAKFRPSESV